MTTPSRLDRHGYQRPAPAPPCHAALQLDDGSLAPCEGLEGHEGPHLARVTRTWTDEDPRYQNPA